MGKESKTTTSGGIGVLGWLGVVFVTLKLLGITEVATWPWWLVTLPLWGGAALVLAVIAIIGVIGGLIVLAMLLHEKLSK